MKFISIPKKVRKKLSFVPVIKVNILLILMTFEKIALK